MHTTKRRLIGVLAAGACALATVSTTTATAATRRRQQPSSTTEVAGAHPHHQLADADPAAVVQRLPRQPRAAQRVVGAQRDGHALDPVTHLPTPTRAERRRCGVPRHPPRPGAQGTPQQPDRRGGRHHRCLPAALGGVPRRAHDRVDEQARARRLRGGQPRVRRGLQGAPADGRRRLHRRRRRCEQPELLRRTTVPRARTSTTSPRT